MNNKRLFLFFAMLAISVWSFSQTYNGMICNSTPNVVWYHYGYDDDHVLFSENYNLGESYIKNGKTYYRLHFERGFLDGSSSGCDSARPDFYATPDYHISGSIGIRESEGRIFVDFDEYMALLAEDSYWSWSGNKNYIPYELTADGELILYDFTKKAGDKFCPAESHEDITVITVISVEVVLSSDGVNRRLQKLSNGCLVLEGVGCINSPGMWLCYLNPSVSPCQKGVLMAMFKENDTHDTIYSFEDSETWTQNINPLFVSPVLTETFDLQGRRLPSPSSKGLYIKDGRKFLVK